MIYDYFNRLTKILIIIHTYRWLGKPSRLILSGFSAVTSSTQILATQNGRLLLHACACAASAYGELQCNCMIVMTIKLTILVIQDQEFVTT